MAIDIFSARSMLRQIETLFTVRTPFLDLFFKEIKRSQSEFIDIDFVTGTRKLAPFSSASVQGKLIEKKGFERRSLQPPYIKIKDVTTAEDLLKTQPGQHVYLPGRTGEQMARQELAKQLRKFIDMIVRRTEFMAHEALSTQGTITFSGDGLTVTVDFNMKTSHKITLAGGDVWSDTANSDPLADIKVWHELIKKDSGLIPNVLVMDLDAAALFMAHPKITGSNSVFDTRRVDMGEIKPAELPSGLEFIGSLRRPRIDLFAYSEYYETDAGVVTPIMTSKTVIMGSQQARGVQHYAAIKDLDARVPVRWFPKSWKENDPSARLLLVQSSPLIAPHQIDGFVHVTVA